MPSGEQPRFVVLEGLDGAGTTTQAALVARALEARGARVCLTAEPSDGPIGAVARAHVRREVALDPVAAALTFIADRADHLARTIRPALEAGRSVVCDRYVLSTLAYQGAESVDRLWVLDASGPLLVPDLTIFLDTPEGERRSRLATRPAPDRYELDELQPRLRTSYSESIGLLRSRGYRIAELDGTRPPEVICAQALAELDALAR